MNGLMGIAVAGIAVVAGQAVAGTARIAAQVLDAETRRPLEGAVLVASFHVDNGWEAWKGAASPNMVVVRTDREGRCAAAGETNDGRAGWIVREVPGGYYRPAHGGWWTFREKDLRGTWQPEGVVSTVLVERVGRPVPLVGRRVHEDSATPARVDLVGKAGGRLAYDFLRGDWLPPVGRGETADVEFVREPGSGRDCRPRLTMRFPGAHDGIVELTPPDGRVPRVRTAPEGGYGPELVFEDGVDAAAHEARKDHSGRTFAFRIRTRRDERGRLVGAYYGKIYGGIEAVTARGARDGAYEALGEPRFRYLLNPSPLDRNLEWDAKTLLGWNPATRRLEPADGRAVRRWGFGREP